MAKLKLREEWDLLKLRKRVMEPPLELRCRFHDRINILVVNITNSCRDSLAINLEFAVIIG